MNCLFPLRVVRPKWPECFGNACFYLLYAPIYYISITLYTIKINYYIFTTYYRFARCILCANQNTRSKRNHLSVMSNHILMLGLKWYVCIGSLFYSLLLFAVLIIISINNRMYQTMCAELNKKSIE